MTTAIQYLRPSADAYAETFPDIQKWIESIVSEFYAKHGGERAEHLAEANLEYMRALSTWNPDKSAFTTYLRIKVWGRLLGNYRKEKYVRQGMNRQDVGDTDFGGFSDTHDHARDLDMATMSKDAQQLVRKALEYHRATPTTQERHQRMLWIHCSENGWTFPRFEAAFVEVQEVLS